jgi:HPt (histidine-containing phosphotransfer) domain-containing protein
MVRSLYNAIEDKNYQKIQFMAHRLKGGGKNIGALRFAELCEFLETAGQTQTIDNVISQYESLKNEYEKSLSECYLFSNRAVAKELVQ